MYYASLMRYAYVFFVCIFCRKMPPKKIPCFRDLCQVCGAITTHLYRHMRRVHLPWYLNPATACVDCHMSAGTGRDLRSVHGRHQLFTGDAILQAWFLLMNGLFLFLSQEMGLGSPIELLGCAAIRELSPRTLKFSEEELHFLREYDARAGLEPVSSGVYITVPPTRLIALTHPELMSRLLSHINHEAICRLKFYTGYTLIDGTNPPSGYPTLKRGIIDSHFHLDKLSGQYPITLTDLEGSRSLSIRLPFAIANYVFPSKWKLLADRVRADPRLRISLGVHPHMITGNQVHTLYSRMEGLLRQYPEAVGIGEVGLDLTTQCRHKHCSDKRTCRDQKIQAQRQFLSLSLHLAKQKNMVLILHVRDGGSGAAALEVLSLLQELDMVNHPIHRHCFVGGEEEYRQWTTILPNCYFSISPVTLRDPKTMYALSSLDNRKRLLLETDSSYLIDFPWSISKVAEEAALSLDMTMTELVEVCNRNAARLYNLPW